MTSLLKAKKSAKRTPFSLISSSPSNLGVHVAQNNMDISFLCLLNYSLQRLVYGFFLAWVCRISWCTANVTFASVDEIHKCDHSNESY